MRLIILFLCLVGGLAHAENNWKVLCDATNAYCGVGQYLVAAEDAKLWLKISFHERADGSIQIYWLMPPSFDPSVVIVADGDVIGEATMGNCTAEYCDARLNLAVEIKQKVLRAKEMKLFTTLNAKNAFWIPIDITELGAMLIKARPPTKSH